MRLSLWSAAAAAITFSASSASFAQASETCTLRRLAELAVTYDTVSGEPVVTTNTAGQVLSFVIDSTAPFSVISDRAAGLHGLQKQHPDMDGATVQMGNHTLYTAIRLPQLQLGRASLERAEFWIGPTDSKTLIRHDGVVGNDLLHLFDVEYDLAHDTIRLFAADHCPGKVAYWAGPYAQLDLIRNSLHVPLFTAFIDGKPIRTQLSTNLSMTSMPKPIARSRFGIEAPNSATTHSSMSELDLGGIVLQHPQIDTGQKSPICSSLDFDPELGLGRNHMKKFRIYVAWNDSQIYFIPAGK